VFKDNISVPTIPAIARARDHLDERGADDVAVANAAMQAIGCLGMRACDSNNCPVGIATQREDLRDRLVIDSAAEGLANFFSASVELMTVMARACGHDSPEGFERRDLTAWKKEVAELAGVEYAGAGSPGLSR
jgi:hypothetical protein